MKQRIKSSRANSIAVLGKLFKKPQSVDRVFRCVVEDVEFDEVPRKKIETRSCFGFF
jgi:hypothetical protein